MVQPADPAHHLTLDDYGAMATLAYSVQELRAEARQLAPQLEGRTVWVVNSTAQGGGVAEMLPAQISLLRELGVAVEWLVMAPERPEFFALTKRIHNLLHGEGDPELGEAERELYERVSREVAANLRERVRPGDLLVVHDPQPLGAGAILRQEMEVHALWRCHIGLDEHLPQTSAAWRFLRPYAEAYDHAVFSAPEYIPPFLAGRAAILYPAIDPLSHKNRELSVHKLVGILCNAGLQQPHGPVVMPPFPEPARRLAPDGSWRPATEPQDIGLLFWPIVTQVSRWDRLKGFAPLLEGFRALKRGIADRGPEPRERRILETVRLVLAGPDPASVADDPEAKEVLDELARTYASLDPALQADVALLSLPMGSVKFNALMVNALQRCSTVVVQNSIREGFGLTATEAMWKQRPVLASGAAAGLRQQVRDGLDGRLVYDPEDPEALAAILREMLLDRHAQEAWGRTGQRRVYEDFLIFSQLRRWLELLTATARTAPRPASQPG
jgi:trehalose synthase